MPDAIKCNYSRNTEGGMEQLVSINFHENNRRNLTKALSVTNKTVQLYNFLYDTLYFKLSNTLFRTASLKLNHFQQIFCHLHLFINGKVQLPYSP